MKPRYLPFYLLFFVFSLFATDRSYQIQDIPLQKLSSQLKSIAFATIRTSILREYTFSDTIEFRYEPCPDHFPRLPGDLPCNLFHSEIKPEPEPEKNKEEKDSSLNALDPEVPELEGGRVNLVFSKTRSPNLNGKVAKLGEDEDKLLLFYSDKGILSHYLYLDEVVVFRYRASTESPQIESIYLIQLGKDRFPISAKKILFP
ncbi:hypothetical protein LPTSP4_02190 [Leptospira ryugenii]|uniref:Uncharacterized protein n=1 Tax=Leptospira ryugenii TaxID=1917863 RepID=A0A2P2DVQ0_9LEPT|nr:hypothetical protein [Leptospira ryugenii]GBF48719.1 hypothetical protein LPTSP4_02190 [Leptospira ryugenii]